jgi:hypothetical protein
MVLAVLPVLAAVSSSVKVVEGTALLGDIEAAGRLVNTFPTEEWQIPS